MTCNEADMVESKLFGGNTMPTPSQRRLWIRRSCQYLPLLMAFILVVAILYSCEQNPPEVKKESGKQEKTETQKIPLGSFSIAIPSEWTPFSAVEKEALAQSFQAQAKEIYQRYNSVADPSSTLDFIAYHTQDGGTFVSNILSIPPQADLMGDLIKEAPQKAKWGIEQGFIKSASPLTTVSRDGFDGFYLETESSGGSHDFNGGLVHSTHKNEVIGLMFIGVKSETAPAIFQKLLGSVSLLDTESK